MTTPATVLVPVACAFWSTTVASAAAASPEYSATAMPMSALAVGVTVMAGLVPPPLTTGALHTLSSVPSGAVTAVSLV
ncbi:hypothetical protein CLV40_1149 [Actinokineospora auranticolor]|uniref:Uncharacterized protein n=1 Tax=Actinokineospora auranticolor TaxID=155976 RepID=A0A2S6GJG2_9PSEU|nr:hypothetical protein CLV40_1149 [Actinokineospora auranticolor]